MAHRLWKKAVGKYEDLDDSNEHGPASLNNNQVSDGPEMELTSVSVIPDGMIIRSSFKKVFFFKKNFRHVYRNASGKRIRFRIISSETFFFHRTVLDGR